MLVPSFFHLRMFDMAKREDSSKVDVLFRVASMLLDLSDGRYSFKVPSRDGV